MKNYSYEAINRAREINRGFPVATAEGKIALQPQKGFVTFAFKS